MFDNFDPRWSEPRDRAGQDEIDRKIYRDTRERGDDPRDALLNNLDLPRGLDRELVLDRDHVYELNGEDSRMLAAAGAFRLVPSVTSAHGMTTLSIAGTTAWSILSTRAWSARSRSTDTTAASS